MIDVMNKIRERVMIDIIFFHVNRGHPPNTFPWKILGSNLYKVFD